MNNELGPSTDSHGAIRRRVLVLASTYPRWNGDSEPGFVHELNRRLVEYFDVHVVCPHAPGAARLEVLDGVTVHRFRYAPDAFETLVQNGGILANLRRTSWKWALVPFFFLGLMAFSWRLIKQIQPHCLHVHWIVPQGLAITLLGVVARKLPPYVITSHGGDLFSFRGWLFGYLKQWVLRRAVAVSVVSQPMLKEAVEFGAIVERTSVIPMGVDFDGRFSLEPKVRRISGEILFVGRLVEKKGVKYLIQALALIRKRLPDAHLVIVGGGPELGKLTTLVTRLGLEKYVEFRGAVSQFALPELYRRATVFAAPFVNASSGDREGLGLVSVEAIACGCPVVVGDVPVVADIFLDSEMDMRAIPGSIESLADKIGDVLEWPEVALARALVVRQRLVGQMGWGVVANRYTQLLKDIAHD